MIGAFKIANNCSCVSEISKSVFSYWPLIENNSAITVANVSLTFSNKRHSPANLTGVNLFFKKGHIYNNIVLIISDTLLDERNPLSVSYTGVYKKSNSILILDKYDGVDNVFVDIYAKFTVFNLKKTNIDCVKIVFSRPVHPGCNVAVRFLYQTKDLFDIDKDKSMHFSNCFLDIDCLYKYFSERVIRLFEIPMLTNYDSEKNGGFDVFFYMPLELVGQEFEHPPLSSVRPRYDYIGRQTKEPLKKFCWPASRVLRIPVNNPKSLRLGDGFVLSGVFCPRILKGGCVMGSVDNRGGVMIVGSDISNSSLSASSATNNQNIDLIVESLLSLVQELEKSMADKSVVPEDKKELIRPCADAIKAHAATKNKKLLELSLDGLRETLRFAGDVLPNIAKAADAIKDLFQ